jgi:Fic-DOC domain mobile mystery protein B
MSLIQTADGNTPLSADELSELIPALATKDELNEFERENILAATRWAKSRKRITANEIVSDEFIRKLHSKMFDQTWKWAGRYRLTEKNIGIRFHEIRDQLGILIGDVRYWIQHRTYNPDEISIRFHHRLVQIHPFPNGNGRHARMIADLLVVKLGQKPFSWGRQNLAKDGDFRKRYIAALQAADHHGDFKPLLEFARS